MLLITHILAGICVGIMFRFWKYSDKEDMCVYHRNTTLLNSPNNRISCNIKNLGEILSVSISNAISSVVMIGGFVVIFSILNSSGILAILSTILAPLLHAFGIDSSFAQPFVSGIVELTNGISGISNIMNKSISTNIVLVAFLLGFGGFSVLLQVFSIISKTDISILPYLLGKLLHGVIAAFFTYLLIHSFPIFNLDLAPAFASTAVSNINFISSFWSYAFITCGIITLIGLFFTYKVKCKN